MKKIINNIFILVTALMVMGCKKEIEDKSELDTLRKNSNRNGFPVTKMDSAQAIESITSQKLQEIFDLSSLYRSGGDTEIDSVIYAQIESYFAEPDSLKMNHLLHHIDSLKSTTVKVGDLKIDKKILKNDTLNFATFTVEHFDKYKKSLGKFNKNAEFTLKTNPVKFKKEFKFYFVDFDVVIPNDSTSSGVMR